MRSFSLLPAAILLVAGFIPLNASAQAFTIEEVTVTARKIEESLQQTPVAITAFSGDELDIRGAVDATSIADGSPNVLFESGAGPSGSSSTPTVFIRGIGQADFLITSDPGVGIYIDGVYVARTFGSLLDLVDVERVEVLRGPQGTLFGRNTIGGAINIISKKPNQEREFKAEMTLGEDDWYGGRASVQFPLSDTVSGRVSGFVRKRDGFVDAVQYDDLQLGNEDVWGARGQLRWEPNDKVLVDLTVDFSQERETPAPTYLAEVSVPGGTFTQGATLPGLAASQDPAFFNAELPTAGFPFVAMGAPGFPGSGGRSGDPACATVAGQVSNSSCYGPVWQNGPTGGDKFTNNSLWADFVGNIIEPESELDTIGVSLDFTWQLPFGEFRSITAYRAFDAAANNDLDGSPYILFHNYNENFNNKQYSQEFQLTGSSFDDQLDWVTGVYLFHEIGEENVTLTREIATLPFHPAGMQPNFFFFTDSRKPSNDSLAWFGQATWHFMERFHLTGGLRFTDDEKRFSLQIGQPGDIAPQVSPVAGTRLFGEQKASEWTPMVNLAIDITDDIMVYGNYSEGFRDGGFPPRLLATPANGIIPNYDPEFVEVWEGGVKSTLFDGSVRANLAVFSTTYTEKQELALPEGVPVSSSTAGVQNIGDADIFGVEFEGMWIVTDDLRLDLALGYLDASWDRVGANGRALSAPFVIDVTSPITYSPEWTFNLGLSYHYPLQNGGELFFRADWVYSDEYAMRVEALGPNSGTERGMVQDAYSKTSASLTYRHPGDRWQAKVGVQNLNDEAWSTNMFWSGVCRCAQRNISRPRSVYGTITYEWGE